MQVKQENNSSNNGITIDEETAKLLQSIKEEKLVKDLETKFFEKEENKPLQEFYAQVKDNFDKTEQGFKMALTTAQTVLKQLHAKKENPTPKPAPENQNNEQNQTVTAPAERNNTAGTPKVITGQAAPNSDNQPPTLEVKDPSSIKKFFSDKGVSNEDKFDFLKYVGTTKDLFI